MRSSIARARARLPSHRFTSPSKRTWLSPCSWFRPWLTRLIHCASSASSASTEYLFGRWPCTSTCSSMRPSIERPYSLARASAPACWTPPMSMPRYAASAA
eukprot:1675036-Pyramimonas_sp.AAC.1